MAYEVHTSKGNKIIKSWTQGVYFEEQAKEQLHNIAEMPFIYKHVAAMPDVHLGKGATVGSVIATKGAIIPAAVGVDIGCGMMAIKTSLKSCDLPDNLSALRSEIEKKVPHGRTNNGGTGDRGAWGVLPMQAATVYANMHSQLMAIVDEHPSIRQATERAPLHLGTLGTGNHFIEICLDEQESVWVMLHSGSRGIGHAIGSLFIEKAKEEMRRYFINLPDQDLAYFSQDI